MGSAVLKHARQGLLGLVVTIMATIMTAMTPAAFAADTASPYFVTLKSEPETVLTAEKKSAQYTYQVSVTAQSDVSNIELVEKWLAKNLHESLSSNPGIVPQITLVTAEGTPEAESENEIKELRQISDEIIQGARASVTTEKLPEEILHSSLFRAWLTKHSQLTAGLTSGFINGAVTSWSLLISHTVPLPVALTAGMITGAMSGSVRYFNVEFGKFLTSRGLLETLVAGGKGKAGIFSHGINYIEELATWYLIEFSFLSIINTSLFAMGVSPFHTLGGAALGVAATATASLFAQGPLELLIKNKTFDALLRNPLKEAQIKMMNRIAAVGVSALSVSLAVADTIGLHFGQTGLMVMGGGGLIATGVDRFLAWKSKHGKIVSESFTVETPACKNLLK